MAKSSEAANEPSLKAINPARIHGKSNEIDLDKPDKQQYPLRNLVKGIWRSGDRPSVDRLSIELNRLPTQGRASALMALEGTYGNRYVQRVISQAKLAISQPRDEYEQEADRVLKPVMSISEAHILQRKCTRCHEYGEGILRAKGITGKTSSAIRSTDVPPIVYDVLGSPGQSLDHTTRAIMERRFGEDINSIQVASGLQKSIERKELFSSRDIYPWDKKRLTDPAPKNTLQSSSEDEVSFRRIDFSRVRIHTGDKASKSAKVVNALAYTVGADIVFGAGKYEPREYEGQKLLAHELMHVVQQDGASIRNYSQKLLAHEMTHMGQGMLQNNLIQRNDDGSGGHEGSSGDQPVSESGPEPDNKTDFAPPDPDEEPRSLKETLLPRNMKRDEILHEISTINQWLSKTRPEESDAELARLTAAEESLENELATTGGRCDHPEGNGHQPDAVSDVLIDRLMGKYATIDMDPGEGCSPTPYIAGVTESVCTIGHGHQITGCPIVDRDNNVLTLDERKKANKSDLKCQCEGSEHFDCNGPQGREQLKSDAANMAGHVKSVVHIDLTQEEFDALVDISLHVGHLPENLVDAIKLYWCTPVGRNYIRSLYLNTALTREGSSKIEKNFINRRKHRVWSEYDTSEPKEDTSQGCRSWEPDSVACAISRLNE